MQQQKWRLGPAALALALGATGTMLVQPTVAHAAKAGRAGRKGGQALPALTPRLLEQVLGKPLTDDQKKGVQEAQKTYLESVAKAVGLTPDELKAKVLEYRKAHRGDKRAGGATQPPATTPPAGQ